MKAHKYWSKFVKFEVNRDVEFMCVQKFIPMKYCFHQNCAKNDYRLLDKFGLFFNKSSCIIFNTCFTIMFLYYLLHYFKEYRIK